MTAYSNASSAYGGDAAAGAASNPYAQPVAAAPVTPHASPALAFILGWIPGVGAIYNGQYVKGLVHALIFGLLVSLISSSPSSMQPLLGILTAAFVFYMPFEALHTATARNRGQQPDEWSGILPVSRQRSGAPIGPIILIAIGVLYLLNTLNLVDFHEISRYWPVILIVIGAWMLYNRVSTPGPHIRSGSTQDDLMESRREH
jgi:TM2 domain-containing membrane protein YozV